MKLSNHWFGALLVLVCIALLSFQCTRKASRLSHSIVGYWYVFDSGLDTGLVIYDRGMTFEPNGKCILPFVTDSLALIAGTYTVYAESDSTFLEVQGENVYAHRYYVRTTDIQNVYERGDVLKLHLATDSVQLVRL